jgi:hypothetical protein
MKRFFFVFSVILIVLLFITAGAMAVMEYGSIKVTSVNPPFLAGWGVSSIPYYGSSRTYPAGDLFVIKQLSLQDVKSGMVILYSGEKNWTVKSGDVSSVAADTVGVVRSDGVSENIPAKNIIGAYQYTVPYLAGILGTLKSAPAIAAFAAVLLLCVILSTVLPSRRVGARRLSKSDGEISSILR